MGSFLPKAWELIQKANLGIDDSSVEIEAVERMFRGDAEGIQPTILVVVDAPWSQEIMKAGEGFVESLESFVGMFFMIISKPFYTPARVLFVGARRARYEPRPSTG